MISAYGPSQKMEIGWGISMSTPSAGGELGGELGGVGSSGGGSDEGRGSSASSLLGTLACCSKVPAVLCKTRRDTM